MEQHILEQLLLGGALVALGISGWVLPYRWNLLRLKRNFAAFFSEKTQQRIPKVMGTLILLFGGFILLATAVGTKLFPDTKNPTPASSPAAEP